MRCYFIASLTLLMGTLPIWSADTETKAVVHWTGSVNQEVFPKLAWPTAIPKTAVPNNWPAPSAVPSVYLSTQKQLDDFWKFVRHADQSPHVDFDNYGVVVLVGTSGGELSFTEKAGVTVLSFGLTRPTKGKVDYGIAVFLKATVEKAIKGK